MIKSLLKGEKKKTKLERKGETETERTQREIHEIETGETEWVDFNEWWVYFMRNCYFEWICKEN